MYPSSWAPDRFSQQLCLRLSQLPKPCQLVQPACKAAGNIGDVTPPGGEGNGTPLQYSCLKNPMDGGAWWAAVHGVAKSQTRLCDFHFSLLCTGEGNGNPFQCSCPEKPRDGGAWRAAVYGVAQSWIRLKWLSSSSSNTPRGSPGSQGWE